MDDGADQPLRATSVATPRWTRPTGWPADLAGPAPPKGWSWSPTTRPPAGAGGAARGRRRPGSSLLVSVLLRPRLGSDRGPGHPGRRRGRGRGVPAGRPASTVAQVAQRPGGSDDAKLGGILTELGGDDSVVVGLGLNVNWEPPLPEGATSLNRLTDSPPPVDREALLDAFLGTWARSSTPSSARTVAAGSSIGTGSSVPLSVAGSR